MTELKSARMFLVGVVVVVITASLSFPPASAGILHNRGVLMGVYPPEVLVFWSVQEHAIQLIMVIEPPWTVGLDFDSFDYATMTVLLIPTYIVGDREPLKLADSSQSGSGGWVNKAYWSNIEIGMDEYGAVTGGLLYHEITFIITPETAPGYYLLCMYGEAKHGEVLFQGFDQVGISVSPFDPPNSGYGLGTGLCPTWYLD